MGDSQNGPSGADKFFSAADHNMLGGRVGVDAFSGVLGVGVVAGLAQKEIGPFQQSPAHLIGGFVVGVGLSEGIRAVTVDKKEYAKMRTELLNADQKKWQAVYESAA